MAQENSTRERSTLYPVFSFDETLSFVEEISKIGGRKVSVETIASCIGASTKTNSFKSKISTAKQFGMIRGTGGAVEITDAGKKLLYSVNEHETKELRISALMNSPLYKKIIERFENQALPAVDKLSNILFLDMGVSKVAKDIAANKFVESATQVGILQNGIIVLEVEDAVSDTPNVSDATIDEPVSVSREDVKSPEQNKPGYKFTIPTLSGAVAEISIPKDVTEKDLDFITMYIQNMLPAFISNLKENL